MLVGEGTIEQLVDSVVDGGGKYSGELCKLVCSCQLMAVVVTQWQWKCNMKCGNSCVSRCQWQCRKLNIVAMGNSTRTVKVLSMHDVYLVALAVFNAGCVCKLKNQ